MADDLGKWTGSIQWLVSNPEKIALILVILAGAWRWIKELIRSAKDDENHETFTEILMRENKELRMELREERRKKNNSANNGNINDRGNDRESPR